MISQFNYPHLLERAISIIDLFTQNVAHSWLTMPDEELTSDVSGIFKNNIRDFGLVLNRCTSDRNVSIFFLCLNRKEAKIFLQHYGISLNADYDEIEAILAEIEKKSEWDINPFEVQVVRHYADWCLRGDIGIIIDLETDFYERMKKEGINPLAKGNEWYKKRIKRGKFSICMRNVISRTTFCLIISIIYPKNLYKMY